MHAFVAGDPNPNVSFLEHRHVVPAVADGQSQWWGEYGLPHETHDLCFLPRGDATCYYGGGNPHHAGEEVAQGTVLWRVMSE